MNLKKLYAATGALAALAAVTYFVKNSSSAKTQDPRVGHPLVLASDLRDVDQIVLTKDAKTLTFDQDKDANKWRLKELYDLPVDMNKLGRDLIDSIADSKVERLISSNPDRIKELGFDGTSIAFNGPNGKTIASVELGRATDKGKQLIKLSDEDEAYLIGKSVSVDSEANSWVAKNLLSFETSKARNVSYHLENGDTFSVARETDKDPWSTSDKLPDGKTLNPTAVNQMLSRLASLNFQSVKAKDDPSVTEAFQHSQSIHVGLDGGKSYDIVVGRRPEVREMKATTEDEKNGEKEQEKKEVVKTPAGPAFVRITSSDADDPVNQYMAKAAFEIASYIEGGLPRKLADLIKDAPPPPPPAPDAKAAPAPAPAPSDAK